jgi:hypothetical protein
VLKVLASELAAQHSLSLDMHFERANVAMMTRTRIYKGTTVSVRAKYEPVTFKCLEEGTDQ